MEARTLLNNNQSSNAEKGVSLEFTVPLPTLGNQLFTLNVNKRVHFQTYKTVKNKFKSAVVKILKDYDLYEFTKCRIDYRLYLTEARLSRKPDLDNVLTFVKKFTNDTLTELNIMNDDNVTILYKTTEEFIFDEAEFDGVKIKITQVGEVDMTIKCYEGEKPKLTKANSFTTEDEVFFVVKKRLDGISSSFYHCYRFRDGLYIHLMKDKDELIQTVKDKYKKMLEKHLRTMGEIQ